MLHIPIYRMIQEESARLREMIVYVILSKKVHIIMCPIFDGYGFMGAFFNSRTHPHVNRVYGTSWRDHELS